MHAERAPRRQQFHVTPSMFVDCFCKYRYSLLSSRLVVRLWHNCVIMSEWQPLIVRFWISIKMMYLRCILANSKNSASSAMEHLLCAKQNRGKGVLATFVDYLPQAGVLWMVLLYLQTSVQSRTMEMLQGNLLCMCSQWGVHWDWGWFLDWKARATLLMK